MGSAGKSSQWTVQVFTMENLIQSFAAWTCYLVAILQDFEFGQAFPEICVFFFLEIRGFYLLLPVPLHMLQVCFKRWYSGIWTFLFFTCLRCAAFLETFSRLYLLLTDFPKYSWTLSIFHFLSLLVTLLQCFCCTTHVGCARVLFFCAPEVWILPPRMEMLVQKLDAYARTIFLWIESPMSNSFLYRTWMILFGRSSSSQRRLIIRESLQPCRYSLPTVEQHVGECDYCIWR